MEVITINMRSTGRGLIPQDWCPNEKGNSGHRDTQGEHHWKMKAETGVKYLEAKEYQGLPASRQKLGER